MSCNQNDAYIDQMGELFDQALIVGDYVRAKKVIHTLKDDGFTLLADGLTEELLEARLDSFINLSPYYGTHQ